VSPLLYFGYDVGVHGAKTACVEKAILDYLYLHTDLDKKADFESLRIDRQELSVKVDAKRWNEFLARFNSKALANRATKFMNWANYA
jgi:hypothetical protein